MQKIQACLSLKPHCGMELLSESHSVAVLSGKAWHWMVSGQS